MTTTCSTCDTYLTRRRPALLRPLGLAVTRHAARPADVLGLFLERVHHRHTIGLPILPGQHPAPKPATPAHIARKRVPA